MTLKGHTQKKWDRESLKPDEILKCIDVCKTLVERVAIITLADTGMRKNEVIRMLPEWTRFDRGKYGQMTIPVRDDYKEIDESQRKNTKRQFVARGPKTKFERRVALSKRLAEVLKEFYEENDKINMSPNTIYKLCVRVGKDAKLLKRVTPHIFRHAWITNAYEAGVAKERIARRVGHIDSHMVETVYLHLDDEETDSELESGGMLDV